MLKENYIRFKINSESIEQFSKRFISINITNNDDISSFIKIGDNIINFDLTCRFLVKKLIPFVESPMTITCWYLKRS